MKRRLFLKGLVGVSVLAPIVAEALTESTELIPVQDSKGEHFPQSVVSKNKILTAQDAANRAHRAYLDGIKWGDEQKAVIGRRKTNKLFNNIS